MPNIRPISDLRNNANEISQFCHSEREPVFITKNGTGDMVVMSIELYERQQALIELYSKLSEAEAEIAWCHFIETELMESQKRILFLLEIPEPVKILDISLRKRSKT